MKTFGIILRYLKDMLSLLERFNGAGNFRTVITETGVFRESHGLGPLRKFIVQSCAPCNI